MVWQLKMAPGDGASILQGPQKRKILGSSEGLEQNESYICSSSYSSDNDFEALCLAKTVTLN